MKSFLVLVFFGALFPIWVFAQTGEGFSDLSTVSQSSPNVQIYVSPKTATFEVGSIFEVQVFLDSKGNSVNTVNLELIFDPRKISVAKPSGGRSIIGIWVEPPTYDNKLGRLKMAGVVPEGVVTSSGLIATVTFKVVETGDTTVRISDKASVYLNDGSGTKANLSSSSAHFSLRNPLNGNLFIEALSHPFSDNWYNNNNPRFVWDGSPDAEGYAFLLDSNPATSPSNEIETREKSKNFNGLQDGIWYFHLKEKTSDAWSDTFHKQIKIDTTPPKDFSPSIDSVIGSNTREYVLLFETSDDASGIAYYEVGILDASRAENSLPVFIQTESPYVLPLSQGDDAKVIVKAFDYAGNVKEGYVALKPNQTKLFVILGGLVFVLVFVLHYLFGHNIWANFRKAYQILKDISKKPEA